MANLSTISVLSIELLGIYFIEQVQKMANINLTSWILRSCDDDVCALGIGTIVTSSTSSILDTCHFILNPCNCLFAIKPLRSFKVSLNFKPPQNYFYTFFVKPGCVVPANHLRYCTQRDLQSLARFHGDFMKFCIFLFRSHWSIKNFNTALEIS